MTVSDTAPCPCGAGPSYAECCGRFHRGAAAAPTALALMRSRYTAFAVGDTGYLSQTWHPSTRPARLEPDGSRRWTRLEILGTERGGPFDTEGVVEFAAHHTVAGRPGAQRERSRFVREQRRWFYVDGT